MKYIVSRQQSKAMNQLRRAPCAKLFSLCMIARATTLGTMFSFQETGSAFAVAARERTAFALKSALVCCCAFAIAVASGCGGGGSAGIVAVASAAPSAPAAVTLNSPEILSSTSARLTWSRCYSSNFHSYKIRYAAAPGVTASSALLATKTSAAETSVDVAGLSTSTTYYFRVYACDAAGLCSGSGEVSGRAGARLSFLSELAVTPDGEFPNGCFCRIFHRSSSNRFVVTFSSGLPETPYNAYKEYTEAFEETGSRGAFRTIFGGDYAAVMVDDYYYLLTGGSGGWLLIKYDSAWNEVASVSVPVDLPVEKNNDQMLAYANGTLVASSLHHDPDNPSDYEGTHHRFYSTNLAYLGKRILKDVQHVNGSSMLFANGTHHLFTSQSWHGQLVSLSYDANWNFLGSRQLTSDSGRWAQGSLFIDGKYYVAYVTDHANPPSGIKVAVLDSDWKLLETIRVYDDPDFLTASDRPWLLEKDGALYVSYDVATFSDPGRVENRDWACRIKAYRINY